MLLPLLLHIPKGLKIFEITDIIGIIAFSISGYLIGVRKNLDLLGVILSAFLTALGGGIIRDVVANREIFAFTAVLPGMVVLISVFVSFVFKFHKKEIENKFLFVVIDTIGLVSFSISGALVGLNVHFNLLGVMFLAFITSVGGGMLRDMLINEIPFILIKNFYASVSLIIGFCLYFLKSSPFVVVVIFVLGVTLRLFAYKKDFHLPKIKI